MKKLFKKVKLWMDYNPPGALTTTGWRLFKEEFKQKAPIRYWITHNFRYKITLPIIWKYKDISYWIKYRTYDKYHVLETGLKPDYYSVEMQMLHVNFNLLKDFVEIEQGWNTYCWSDEYKAVWYRKFIPYALLKKSRKAKYGVRHFEWASTLDDPTLPIHEQSPQQAADAREILSLYKWWVEDRPNRKEVEVRSYGNQGIDDLLACFDDDFDRESEDYKNHIEDMEKRSVQSTEWNKEDTDMLIRLIKVRNALWT